MNNTETSGNCFLCGEELTKIQMKNHVLKSHLSEEKGEKVMLLKVEGEEQKEYWLLLDIALNATLKDLDVFLRKIWLECCNHMSEFYTADGCTEFNIRTKINDLTKVDKFINMILAQQQH